MERRLIASLMVGTAALLGAAAAKAAPQAAPQYGDRHYGGGQTIRCESPSNRYRECAMDTRGGVQLTRQLSSTRCEEGRNWGQGRNGVWVDRGCRAEFTSARGGWGNGGWSGNRQRIRCGTFKVESFDRLKKHFDSKGIQLHPGDAPNTLRIKAEDNLDCQMQFIEAS